MSWPVVRGCWKVVLVFVTASILALLSSRTLEEPQGRVSHDGSGLKN